MLRSVSLLYAGDPSLIGIDILATDIEAILSRVSNRPQYITQEAVIWNNNNNIKVSEYTPIGAY